MSDLLGMIIQGVCTGLGVAVGQWFYSRHLENRLNSINEKLNEVKNNVSVK